MSIDNLEKNKQYQEGFVTELESESFPAGLDEQVVRNLSAIKNEPEWLLDFRLKAFKRWESMSEPEWGELVYEPVDYQALSYHSAPKKFDKDEIPPEIFETFEKLGVPLHERDALLGLDTEKPKPDNLIPTVAVDAVSDSVSVATTFKAELEKHGIVFCSISEAVQSHPDLVKKYLGTVIPYTDNYFATLNSAVFSDGTFCYIPKGVTCPMELNTYFRIKIFHTFNYIIHLFF